MKVLMITSEWPSEEYPNSGIFINRQYESLKQEGLNVEIYPFRGGGSVMNYLKHRKQIKKVILSFEPDIFHAQFAQSALLVLGRRGKLVVTYRGSDIQGVRNNGKLLLKGRVLRYIGKLISLFTDCSIVVSHHLKHQLLRQSNVHLIPSGLDLNMFNEVKSKEVALLKQKYSVPFDKFIILFPNNTTDSNKNYSLALKVIEKLPEDDKRGIYFLRIHNRPHRELLEIMRLSNLLIFTSLNEGSPNIIKEAIAMNLPILSVPVGDVPSRLKDIDRSFVSPSYDTNILVALLKKILRIDYSNYRSEDHALELSEEILTKKLYGIYTSLLDPS